MKKELFVIRWSDSVPFPDGGRCNMASYTGTREEAEAYAQQIAKKNNVTVEAVA